MVSYLTSFGDRKEIAVSLTYIQLGNIDVNSIDRKVVASECVTAIEDVVAESLDFEVYLKDRILEIESSPDIVFDGASAIMLKRVGMGI